MYKVFFKESSFLLTDQPEKAKNNQETYSYTDQSSLQKYICRLLTEGKLFHISLYHPDLEQLIAAFQACFMLVGAAGGIVEEKKSILVIKRFGLYDLPKGHIEMSENTQACAIREVEEECGVKELKIKTFLGNTRHIYPLKEKWHLKQTAWFSMTCPPGQRLTPQKEEGIEEVYWFDRKDIPCLLPDTYASLRDLFSRFLL